MTEPAVKPPCTHDPARFAMTADGIATGEHPITLDRCGTGSPRQWCPACGVPIIDEDHATIEAATTGALP